MQSLEIETWTPIPDFIGYYTNRRGEIASSKLNGYKLLSITSKQSQTVRLTVGTTTKTHHVHDLVANTFISNPDHLPFVKHLNEESWDNRPENLMWVEEKPTYRSQKYHDLKLAKMVSNHSEWKTIATYPDYYFHSEGRCISAVKGVEMKIMYKPKPCLILWDYKDDKGMVQMAWLMATAFRANLEGYTEVLHLDGDVNNVAASNLMWDVNSPTSTRDLRLELQDADMWKPIKEYPGYTISKQGEVVSRRSKHYKLMKPLEYETITSYRLRDLQGGQHTVHIQKLLGLAFIPNPLGYEFVAPRNGNMSDYDLDNLFWHANPQGYPESGWIACSEFPRYEVSEFGIRNKDTKIMLNPSYKSNDGYPAVALYPYDDDKAKMKYVHVMIAKYHIPNPKGLPYVNHKDGDHCNYHSSNLEWCTASQNLQHAYDSGLRDGSTSVTMIPSGHETWKPIEFAPQYEVSDNGMIRKGTKMFKLRNLLGYHTCTLTLRGGSKKYPYVHRLVAFAFLDRDHLGHPLDPDQVYEVNHKNRIRSDNRLCNLEILTVQEHRRKDQGKACVAVNPTESDIKHFDTVSQAAAAMGLSMMNISKALRDYEDRNGWYYLFGHDVELEDKIEALLELSK